MVIVFGAWVRITGSGAGCGQHWPTCHGEVIHRPQSVETVIELTHRVTSGLSMLLAVALLVWGMVRFERGHPARRGVALAMLFMIFEALLGAGLVLLELVGRNDSISRAVMMAIHLSNTCLLTGAMAAAAWCARPDRRPRTRWRDAGRGPWLLVAGLFAVILVSMSGAVTALGDTLYPVVEAGSVGDRLAADQGVTAHFLQRMRVVHPLLAVLVGLYLLWLSISLPGLDGHGAVRSLGNVVAGLVLAQLCAGVVNIMLSAPGWMQLVHLGLATGLWVGLVLLALAALRADAELQL
ncbi:COX15/CtaA family protein [Pseudenhygromyxa sp. WMMC2535]|nr:COX15/CtaA family protein [Pseudenhygromyxa sp. WMMC2535]